ncbi:MAG: TetR/AcrR family transcriptional regulator [Acidimicrobiales bacterium]
MATEGTTTRLGADERKLQLLVAALHTFGANGFTATSMNDVAEAAGVTKPVVYQHFDSKHHLYLELLSQTRSRLVELLSAAVESAGGPREQLERAFNAYFHFFADEPANFTVLYGEGVRSDPHFTEELRAVEDTFVSFTAEYIDIEGVERDDRLMYARAVAGLLEGAVRRWIQEGERRNPDELSSMIFEFAWKGLRGVRAPD